MDLGLGNTLLPGDSRLVDHIVGEVKSQGIFDQFRKDALADVDTKVKSVLNISHKAQLYIPNNRKILDTLIFDNINIFNIHMKMTINLISIIIT